MALAEALVPRMHVAERLLSLHRAQPAPPLHTRRLLPAERRDTAWALVAGGQQGRCRDVGWGWWDGLIGYDIPTVGQGARQGAQVQCTSERMAGKRPIRASNRASVSSFASREELLAELLAS